jgi:predicted DNA-binding protein
MLLHKEPKKEDRMQSISFRIEKELISEFKTLCKTNKIYQSTIIKNAMKLAIKEMKELENAK